MAELVEIRSIRALAEIRERLGQLSSQVRNHADEAQDRTRSQFRLIEELGRDRLDELSSAQHEVNALDEEDSGESEYERLETAEEALLEFRAVARDCHDARKRFEAAVTELANRGATLAHAALSGIDAKIAAADAYMAIRLDDAPSSSIAGGGSSATPTATTAPPTAQHGDDRFGYLPPGFAWVQLADLPEKDFLTDPSVFKKVKRGDMRRGVELLRDNILPAVNANPALNRDDIVRLDQQRGTGFDANGFVHADSLVTVWDAFLDPRREAEVVVVAHMPDGGYDVINGRHRLGLARELGMQAIPCKMQGDST